MQHPADMPAQAATGQAVPATDAMRVSILIFSYDTDDAYEIYLALLNLDDRIENITIVSDFDEFEHALQEERYELVICGSRNRPALPQDVQRIADKIGKTCNLPVVDIVGCSPHDDATLAQKALAQKTRTDNRNCNCPHCPLARTIQFVIGDAFDMTELEDVISRTVGCLQHP